jgi:phenylalanyl-tRNA synthetase beta chain
MQFPESWLREFCNPPITTQALADVLTMAGLEVEELKAVAPMFTHVVVGEIVEVAQHPNADRLRVCKVNAGEAQLLNIVCGAPNARVGIKIPCAKVGAELPPGEDGKPFKIKVGQLRGVQSEGMLCSAKELGISEEGSGLLELAQDATNGQNIREYLNLDDNIFVLKLTPNLAHCLSVYGVARELSALTGAPLRSLADVQAPVRVGGVDFIASSTLKEVSDTLHSVAVDIEATDLCGRFSARVMGGLNTRTQVETPLWMRQRLERCGQRSVSPLVDISNYVMFESGQPTHIFDRDKINGSLRVRWAKPSESLKLLNGNTVTLDAKVGVIADDVQLESLAGIMGGDASSVGDETQNIYIEAAFWWPSAIVGRARRFNFSTDAAHRFERGVDPTLSVWAIGRITQLVQLIFKGQHLTVGALLDHSPNVPQPRTVELRVERAVKVIGMPISQERMVDALVGLGLSVEHKTGLLRVTAPSYRFDIQIEEDLIEEVARMIGFEHLPSTPPVAPITPKVRAEKMRAPYAIRRRVAALGYQETINFSFVKEEWEKDLAGNLDPIKLLNPIAAPMSVMRSSLLGSLLEVLRFNLDRKANRVRLFEVGRIFKKDLHVEHSNTTVAGIDQPMRIAGLAYGPHSPLQWASSERLVDFFDIKADVEALFAPVRLEFKVAKDHPALHPGRSAVVLKGGQEVGFVGELHPKHRQSWGFTQAPILFEFDWESLQEGQVARSYSVPRFQTVERDIAVVVKDSVTHEQLMQAIMGAPTAGLVKSACLFDIYRPKGQVNSSMAEGEQSLAIRLSLLSEDATLTDAQIESTMAQVLKELDLKTGARLRV